MNLTDQQQTALSTTDVSVALSAGAGCGKTFVLTQRFLRAIGPGSGTDVLPQIVAITFTERASREMRDRIRRACEERLIDAPADEQSHWLQILRAIDTARISTIHAFCATLLRTFAVEAELDPQFAVLEEADARTLRRRSVTSALHDLLSAHDEDAMELVLLYGLERCHDLLMDLARGRFHAGESNVEETAQDRAARWLDRWQTEFIPLVLKRVAESPAAQTVLTLLDAHDTDNPTMRERRAGLLNEIPALPEATDGLAALESCRSYATVTGKGVKTAWDDDDIYQNVKIAFENLRKEIDKAKKLFGIPVEDVNEAADVSVRFERVARIALNNYGDRKSTLGALDFDDLLLNTRDLLRDHPRVRAAAAVGISFLMVDEFQDTDPVQSQIVRDLCGEELLAGKLFLVGDIKQSIYRFRRADPRVFTALREEFPESGRLPLSVNFRSQPAILDFVNGLFAPAMGDDYEPLIPHADQLSPTPAIEFLFAAASPDEDVTGESAEDRRIREAEWIATRLSQLLHDPTPRIRHIDPATSEPTLRPVQPGDVAILFRALSNVHLYEEALRRKGIDYYLVGGRAFFAQQEVYDLMNLLSYLDEPDDGVALAGILRSPMFGLTDDTLLALTENGRTLTAAIQTPDVTLSNAEQQALVVFASALLAELRSRKDRMPLAELLEEFIERTGYDAILLTEFLGRRQLANLHKLIDTARGFDASGLLTLAEFVERLRESVAEQAHEELAATHPETSDVVRLMTIHQSKGLEFPVVVVADMDWSRQGSAGVHFHEQLGPLLPMPPSRDGSRKNLGQVMHSLEEEPEDDRETQRLLYVATTRAADHLILSAGLRPDRRVTSPWLRMLAERFDLQTGLPAVDPHLGTISLQGVPPERIPDITVHHTAPESGKTQRQRESKLPLSKVRETLAATEPGPLPATLIGEFQSASNELAISVTRLLQADRALRLAEQPTPIVDDPAEELITDELHTNTSARTLGTLIHQVIERLPTAGEGDIESLVTKTAARMPVTVPESICDIVIDRVRKFIASPIHAEIASASVCHREVDFVYQVQDENPRIVVHGQIDCLYQSAVGEWTLLDFKTGDAHDDLLDDYLVQLAIYASAAEQALGVPIDCVGIVHIHESIQSHLLPAGAATSASAKQRVNAALASITKSLGSHL